MTFHIIFFGKKKRSVNWPLIGQPHSDVGTHSIIQTTSTRGRITLQITLTWLQLWLLLFLCLSTRTSTLYFLSNPSGQSRCPLGSGSAIGFFPQGIFSLATVTPCLLWGPSWFSSDCTKCFEMHLVVIFHCTHKSWLVKYFGMPWHWWKVQCKCSQFTITYFNEKQCKVSISHQKATWNKIFPSKTVTKWFVHFVREEHYRILISFSFFYDTAAVQKDILSTYSVLTENTINYESGLAFRNKKKPTKWALLACKFFLWLLT